MAPEENTPVFNEVLETRENAPEAFDEDDTPQLLEREFVAGSGFKDPHELPPSDFEGFPTEDVEVEV